MNRAGRSSGGNRWKNVDPWDRILAKVEKDYRTGCWNWIGARNRSGYGMVSLGGQRIQAYRATWELHHKRAIPEGMEMDHLCGNPLCVNPLHVEPVTRRENILRSSSFAAKFAAQTHCKRGHEFTEANTYVSKRGERACRSCRAAREYARRHGIDFETYVHGNLSRTADRMRELVGDLA